MLAFGDFLKKLLFEILKQKTIFLFLFKLKDLLLGYLRNETRKNTGLSYQRFHKVENYIERKFL